MIVFEDKKDDILSILFRAAYPKEISEKFVYAGGNGNLASNVEYLLDKTNEKIFVYMDTVPANPELKRVYEKLKRLSKISDYRVIPINIVCAEYYFLQAFGNDKSIQISNVGLDIALTKKVYYNSPLIQTASDLDFTRTFEKYCKLVLIKNYKDCVKHTRKGSTSENKNLKYGFFYNSNCLCLYADSLCLERDLMDKACRFVQEYPYYPEESYKMKKKEDTEEKVWNLHRRLVDEYNMVVEIYNANPETELRNRIAKRLSYVR